MNWAPRAYAQRGTQLQDYGERLARAALETIPPGHYRFTDYMDDDGRIHARAGRVPRCGSASPSR